MGFLEEIERRRKQELDREKEAERQKQLAAQKEAERLTQRRREHEANTKGFIADCQMLVPVLEQLNQLGYRDYLKSVSEISGFGLDWTFYMRHPYHDYDRGLARTEEKIEKLLVELFPEALNRNIDWSRYGKIAQPVSNVYSTNSGLQLLARQ